MSGKTLCLHFSLKVQVKPENVASFKSGVLGIGNAEQISDILLVIGEINIFVLVVIGVELDPFQSDTFSMGELGFGLGGSDGREFGAESEVTIFGAGVLGAQRGEGSLWEMGGFGETSEASFGRLAELISCMDNSL